MKLPFIVSSCLFAVTVNAASINPNYNVEILFVDGEKIEEKTEAVDVSAGQTQLVLRYSKNLKDSGENRTFDSAPYVVMLTVGDKDLDITAPTLYSYEQANTHFKSDPEWLISDESGHTLHYTQEKLDRGEGFLPYYDLPKLVASHNNSRGIIIGSNSEVAEKAQVISTSVTSASVTKTAESGDKKMVKVDTTNLEQLQAWYLKASVEERKEFRRWMVDQD